MNLSVFCPRLVGVSVSLTTEGRSVSSCCCVSRGEDPVIMADVRDTGRAGGRCVCVRRVTVELAAVGGPQLVVRRYDDDELHVCVIQ